jgi:Fe-coproporphyrin III synthase
MSDVVPIRRPVMIARLTYILRHVLLGRQRPFLASFKLTYRCNLRCLQCPFCDLHAPELNYSQALAIIARLYQRGSRMLIFEGGEPLLWHDGSYRIHDLVRAAQARFFAVGITTNGTQPLDVPSDVLWVSLDGLEETHNRLRGAPVFATVMDNIAASQHPRLYAHITANAQNAEEIPDLIRLLHGRVRGMTIQFYYPYNQRDALFLDFSRRAALLDEILTLKRSGYAVLNSAAALRALKANTWTCHDRLVDNADPDGRLQQGCYLKGRGDIDCARCGFSPHTEISLACQGHPGAIAAGLKIFF